MTTAGLPLAPDGQASRLATVNEADRTGVMLITTATSAGLGFVLGGPGGAAIGAVIPEIVRELTAKRITSMKIAMDHACNFSGVSEPELINWVRADTAHAELVIAAVEAACQTLDPDRLRALGYVLAGGLADDAKIDNSRLLVDALRDLQPAHVSVLRTLMEAPSPRESEVRTGQWSIAELAELHPNLAAAMDSIMATLQRLGCTVVAPNFHLVRPGKADVENESMWMATGFGRHCLEVIRQGMIDVNLVAESPNG